MGGNDDPGVVRASGGAEEDEALPEEDLENLDDSAAADAQLEALLLERAERIQGVEEARLGRGRRERKTVLPSNVDLFDTRKKKGKKGRETLDGDGDGDGLAKGTGLSQSPHSAD